ncbi:CHAD domain-containing protein [Nocardia sp. NPDC006044]|uniref:CYTH and CHAD domain-containing protein n=1 Tax=Nocardia sp. NPDC006044 TaxID=3364306 RepID=UPI0036939532
MKDVVERETKWEVDREFTLPPIDDIVPGGRVEETSVELTSTYFDTTAHDLLTHDLTLRRRAGDDESGWQLKVPQADGRVELVADWSDDMPSELADVVTGAALGQQLRAITTIHTLRNRHRLLGPDGDLVLELDDDVVRTTPVDADADALAWREIEVELGPHTDAVPALLVDRLAEAGASRAQYPSKLARAVPKPGAPVPASKAERAIRDYLTAQIDTIFAGDVALRRGEDPIHDTRVATRRLRSTLRVFGTVLDRSAVDGIADELKWYAGLLGAVRDCQVQRSRLAAQVGALPPELVLGPVAARIETTLLERQLAARAVLAEAMDSPRYLALLAALQSWKPEPPFAIRSRKRELVRRARRAARKADKRLAEAMRTGRDDSLHRARKAAKRARYAAELHRPVRKRAEAKSNIKYYKRLQRVLGDHNDGVVSAEFLWRTATAAGTAQGENGFTYGLLYANEKHAAERARTAVAAVARRR